LVNTYIGHYKPILKQMQGGFSMAISFLPLWETMKAKGITTYDLKYRLKIGGGTYNRLKNNEHVSTHTLELLCNFIDCEVNEIICFTENQE